MAEITGDMRRTSLANERTQLAWWRTGLTSLAVALAVGKLVPDIGHRTTQWPYTLVGLGFVLYGIALIGYGSARSKAVDEAAARGEYSPTPHTAFTALALLGIALGLLTGVLLLVD
jgi:inner membrane protein YidH